MLERTAVETMIRSGSATLADIATHFNVSLADVYSFAREHGLKEPTLEDLNHVKMLTRARKQKSAIGWERLLSDDRDGRIVNGIDTLKTSSNVNAVDVINYYHGACRCYYTGEPTDILMAADANPQNILVSNLVPIVQAVMDERFKDTSPFVLDNRFTFAGGIEPINVAITIEHRFDKILGSACNRPLVEESVETWLQPYLDRFTPADILDLYELPMTPDLLALWVWRQLERKALLKGLARVKVELQSQAVGYVTKHTVLNQCRQMLQRQFGQRSVLSASPAVMPPRGHGSAPERLIKL